MAETVSETPGRLRDESYGMCQQTVDMLRLTWEGFRKQDLHLLEQAEKLGQEIHAREKLLTGLVVQRAGVPAAMREAEEGLFFVPLHLERIGDHIESLLRASRSVAQEGVPLTERALREINSLFEKAVELLECLRDAIPMQNRVLLRHIQTVGQQYEAMASDYALTHQQRLIEGVCVPRASSVYVALLDYFKGISWHTCQVADRLSALAGA